MWQGEDLKGKTLFLVAEQGIGDEILFACAFRELASRGAHLVIGCTERLVTIFQRSFPDAHVHAFTDTVHDLSRTRRFPGVESAVQAGELQIDYILPFASALQYLWQELSDIPSFHDPYIKADDKLIAHYRRKIAEVTDHKPLIFSWRSGKFTIERKKEYINIDNMIKVLRGQDRKVLSVQYSATEQEMVVLREALGDQLIELPDVDFRNDIEANLAIMQCAELMLGPLTAPTMFAAASGVPCWAIGPILPWWAFGLRNGDQLQLFPNLRVKKLLSLLPEDVVANRESTWSLVTDEVRKDLKAYLASSVPQPLGMP